MLPSGDHRRPGRTALIVIQLLVFATYLFGPTATFAEDPTPEPSPAESPAPEATPDPTAERTPEQTEPAAPEPEPTEPPAAEATPEPTAEPAAEPTPDPTATPAGEGLPFLITFAAGTSDGAELAALAAAGATDVEAIPQLAVRSILLDSATFTDQLATLRATPGVLRVEADRIRDVEAAPTDSSYAEQWSLPHIGWEELYGSAVIAGSATIAILDTGVDATHPDLDGVVLPGWSALAGADPLTDPNGHGTWMAGIVAAETDNAFGIAGTAYDGVSVLPVTVLGADGTGHDSDIIAGVVHAADAGADVILMAFSNPGYSTALQAAIDYAWASGSVLVAATGNDGVSTATFPAGDRGVIGVTSTDASDAIAASANRGPAAFMAAPGVDIATTSAGGSVATISGTSAAAAAVAGAAALLAANEPELSNGVVVSRLARTADAAGDPADTGNGRLNLLRAMADASLDAIQPAGVAPLGTGGPFVGPYVAAAPAPFFDIAPNHVPAAGTRVFSALVRNVTAAANSDTARCVRITTPSGVAISSATFTVANPGTGAGQTGIWTLTSGSNFVQVRNDQPGNGLGLAGTALTSNNWVRFEITASLTAAASGIWSARAHQTGTSDCTAGGSTSSLGVRVGVAFTRDYTADFRDASNAAILAPTVVEDTSQTYRIRVTRTAGGDDLSYAAIALPTCFTNVTGITTTDSGAPNFQARLSDNVFRLVSNDTNPSFSGTKLAANGEWVQVTFTATADCATGLHEFRTAAWKNTSPQTAQDDIFKLATGTGHPTLIVVGANGSIKATKYNDLNGSGSRNAGEPGLVDWRLFLDRNGNETFEAATDTSPGLTDSNGEVVFSDLPAGTYTLCEVLQAGWANTDPSGSTLCETVIVIAGAQSIADLGNRQLADVSIAKSDSADPVTAGSNLTYTITVTNESTADTGTTATGITVSDSLPANTSFVSVTEGDFDCTETAGSISCTLDSLAIGTSESITYVVKVDPSFTGSSVSNTASVSTSGDTLDPNAANDSDTETTAVTRSADVAVTKSDGQTLVTAGDGVTYTYTITATNNGPSTATAISLTDDWPADGFSRGTVTSSQGMCDTATPDVDDPDFTCALGTLAPGASATVSATYTVPSNATAGTRTNTATATSAVSDATPVNNSVSDTTTVIREADLEVTKTDVWTGNAHDPVVAGASGAYRITVTNHGPSSSSGFTVTDTLPAGLSYDDAASDTACNAGSGDTVVCTRSLDLADEASVSYVIAYDADPAIANNSILTNEVAIDGDDPDPVADNDRDTEDTTVIARGDLSITKTDSPDPVIAGTNLTYTLSVDSSGPSDALNVTVSDALPAGTVFVAATGGGGSYDADTHTVSWSLGTVSASDPADVLSITVSVPSSTSATAVLSNTASVASDTTDPEPLNNTDTELTQVDREANLAVTKTDEWAGNDHDPVVAGASGAYQITVTNRGPSSSSGFTVTDTLPAGFTYDDDASDAACNAGSGNTVVCTSTAELADEASVSFVIAYDVSTTLAGTTQINAVSVDGDDPDPIIGNDSDTETTVVNRRNTETTVTCAPDSVAVNQGSVCTAVVDDIDEGTKSNPSGTVTFTRSGAGTGNFSSPTCTLAPVSGDPDSSSCQVGYRPTSGAGTHAVEGAYGQSALHNASSGSDDIAVRLRDTTTTLSCTPLIAPINQTITCTATVIDVDAAGTKTNPQDTVTFNPAGTQASCTLVADPFLSDRSSCSVTYTRTTPDVIGVTASYGGSDVHEPSQSDRLPIVFYDPNGGFITGGGYFWHTASMTPAGLPLGKNNFGFVAKYVKNSTVPQGEFELQCKVCDMNFHAKTYDWLVIQTLPDGRKKAQAQGTGTINGAGSYGFIVTVIDGANKPDYIRIRIWDKTTGLTVYDNQPLAIDDQANPTTLAEGGNIVIHK